MSEPTRYAASSEGGVPVTPAAKTVPPPAQGAHIPPSAHTVPGAAQGADVPRSAHTVPPPAQGADIPQGGIPPEPSTQTTSGQQSGGFVGTLKESMRKMGHAIDTGIGSLMTEAGQNVRTTCPGCSLVVLAPPGQYVQCPQCLQKFNSPTWAQRTAEIGRNIRGDLEEVRKPQPSPGAERAPSGPAERHSGA